MSTLTSSAAWSDSDGPGSGVRVYRGRNLIDLIPRIRADLGPDAVILRERQGVIGGINGFFAKRFVEVEAQAAPRVDVYDDDGEEDGEDDLSFADELSGAEVQTEAIISAEEQRLVAAGPANGIAATLQREVIVEPQPVMEPIAAAEPHPQVRPEGRVESQPPAPKPRPAPEPEPEVAAPAAVAPRIAPQPSLAPQPQLAPQPEIPVGPGFRPPPAYEPEPETEASWASEPEYEIESEATPDIEDPLGRNVPVQLEPLPPPRIKKKSMRSGRATAIARQRALRDGDVGREAWVAVAQELIGRGMTDTEAERLAMEAAAHGIPLARASALRDAVREMLARQLTRAPTLPASGAAVAFVGAGGAGKTRCAAALASAYRRASTLAVMALSLGDADDRRMIEALLSTEGVPVKTGSEVRSLPRLVSDVRAGGVVIVDTPAIAPGDRNAVLTLAERLEPLRLDGVFVAVPATIGPQAARQLLSGLEPLRPSGIAVTHLDETDQLGVPVELAAATGTPIAYVHEGLDLRRALSAPDPVQIATRLLP